MQGELKLNNRKAKIMILRSFFIFFTMNWLTRELGASPLVGYWNIGILECRRSRQAGMEYWVLKHKRSLLLVLLGGRRKLCLGRLRPLELHAADALNRLKLHAFFSGNSPIAANLLPVFRQEAESS